MKWIILLVLGVVFGEEEVAPGLGDRILSAEQECARLYTLNEHWNSNKYNERAVLYVDLFFLCEESLAEDKHAYIEENHIDLSKYPGEHFPVTTSNGATDYVDKPPVPSNNEVDQTTKNKLKGYLKKFGGKLNPMYKLSEKQSKLSQEIVDRQVSCELKAIMVTKHPEVVAMNDEHTKCMDELNCLKERFMEEHGFTLDKYPDYFPILYKGRGTMIDSPPHSDGTSLCVQPVHSDHYKIDLQKWDITKQFKNIEKTTESKIENMQDAGTELIKRLKDIGMRGGVPMMTKEEMDKLMDNVESITVVEDDGTESKDQPIINADMIKQSATNFAGKLHDLQNDGKSRILKTLDKLNEVRSDVLPLNNFAEKLDHVKIAEANKIRFAIKKTMKGLSDREAQLQKMSEPIVEDVKGSMSQVNDAQKQAASKLRQDTSILVEKLRSKINSDLKIKSPENNENDDEHPGGWLGELAHSEFDKIRKADVETLLARIGHAGGTNKDMLSEDHFLELLNNMKKDIKEKAQGMHIHSKEVKQAAVIVKGVLYSVLNAAKHGHGPAKGMTNKEVQDAKFMVNQLVDFATAEIFPNEEEETEDDDASNSKEDVKSGVVLTPYPPTANDGALSDDDVPRVIDLTRVDDGDDEFSFNSVNKKDKKKVNPKLDEENQQYSDKSDDKVKTQK